MIRFPVADTALEGFRLTREHPRAVLIWAGLLLAGNVAMALIVIGGGHGAELMQLSRMRFPEDAERLSDLGSRIAPVMLAVGLLNLMVNTLIYTAVMRAVLNRGEARTGFLKLGREEVLVFAVLLVLALAASFYMAATSTVVAMLRLSLGDGAAFLGAALAAAATGMGIYALLRLSLAPAMTMTEGRFSLMRSWPLTVGQFWGLLGMVVLAITLSAVVFVLAEIVLYGLASVIALAVGQPGALTTMASPNFASFAAYFAAPTSIGLVFNALLTALLSVILLAPLPAAFRVLSGRVGATEPSRA